MKKVLELVGEDESRSDTTWLDALDLDRAKCMSCQPFAILTVKDLVSILTCS